MCVHPCALAPPTDERVLRYLPLLRVFVLITYKHKNVSCVLFISYEAEGDIVEYNLP